MLAGAAQFPAEPVGIVCRLPCFLKEARLFCQEGFVLLPSRFQPLTQVPVMRTRLYRSI
jgi:hypothetical protein